MALTPMMQQYLEIKKSYPDALLLFRLGDFYELFFEDAVEASKVLEITLTGRDAGEQGRVPMCGVPYHAALQYIGRLMESGYCVAICEQMEDPKQAKGLVKREVIRVVTPGTWMKEGEAEGRYMASLVRSSDNYGCALVDVSTGELRHAIYGNLEALSEVLVQWNPIEVLVSEQDADLVQFSTEWCTANQSRFTILERMTKSHGRDADVILEQYGVGYTESLGLDDSSPDALAIARLLRYLKETQKQVLGHLKSPQSLLRENALVLDTAARRNLELTETQRTRQKRGSLFGLLDKTQTAMGSRLLRRWTLQPLARIQDIEERLDAVEWLVHQLFVRAELEELSARIYDLERLIGKVGFGSVNARDLVAIAQSLAITPQLVERIAGVEAKLLNRLASAFPDLSGLGMTILSTFVDQPPVSTQDGGMVRSGVDDELDTLRAMHANGKDWLAQFEQRERESTGIRSLKIGYNKVFGYYIEVSKANVHLVPDTYERKQTLASAERYTHPELKEREDRILHAQESALAREYALFAEIRNQVQAVISDIQRLAECVANLDVLTAMASVSAMQGYVRPAITETRGIDIRNGRHPMVEAANPGSFVPNNVRLDDAHSFILLTGPNMAGKSTYMRQTALIVLMAHMGCFVPADEASVGVVDRIFTRIGASDDLGAGQSTFMVEMVELAQILRQATSKSLVLLDEIGRGTSTYDGMSLAEAAMEALLQHGRNALTLFATHYHELTVSSGRLPGVRNLSVAVQETKAGVTFLHTVVERPADRSYGIQVAKLAGVPNDVTERAAQILAVREATALEGQVLTPTAHLVAAASARRGPLDLGPVTEVLEQISEISVETMTPIEAISELHRVIQTAKEAFAWVKSKS